MASTNVAIVTTVTSTVEPTPIGNEWMEQIPDPGVEVEIRLAEDEMETETDPSLPSTSERRLAHSRRDRGTLEEAPIVLDGVLKPPQSEPEPVPADTFSTKQKFETVEIPVCERCDGALFSSYSPRFVRSDLLQPLDKTVLEEMDEKDMHFFHHLDMIGSSGNTIEGDGVSRIRDIPDRWYSGCFHYYHNACLLGIIQDTILTKHNKTGISPSSMRFRCTAEHCEEYFGFPEQLLTYRMQPSRMKELKICKDHDAHTQLGELIESERKLKVQVAQQAAELAELHRWRGLVIEVYEQFRTVFEDQHHVERPKENTSTAEEYPLLPEAGERKTEILHNSPQSDPENIVATEQTPVGSGAIIVKAPPMSKKKRRKPPPGRKNNLKAKANGTKNRASLQQAKIKIRKKYDLLKYNNTLIKGSKVAAVGVNVRYAQNYDKEQESPVNKVPPPGPVDNAVFIPKTVGKNIMETEASPDPAELLILKIEVDAVC